MNMKFLRKVKAILEAEIREFKSRLQQVESWKEAENFMIVAAPW